MMLKLKYFYEYIQCLMQLCHTYINTSRIDKPVRFVCEAKVPDYLYVEQCNR